ncbi:glycosyltransferase family 4 protein [Dongia deserti]|uniref:glycosyltransferase family 4 protein n=1 Tax=Dongia deserti TaxID=2268030 RepID=UPI000E65AE3C|nr:glycosyltransferase family 4 protein [Dongia deserti]
MSRCVLRGIGEVMTRLLFFAPLKAPDHPTPSGDRTMGRLIVRALKRAGFEVELASRLRTRIAAPSLSMQYAKRDKSFAAADRVIARERRRPKAQRAQAFFTYHLYYKAVDWIGPRVAAALDIPYLVAEASHAPKRATGDWAFNHTGAEAAIRRADAIFCLNSGDKECLALLTQKQRLVDLPPFLDLKRFAPALPDHATARATLVRRWKVDEASPWLLAVGMMRVGDKLASYRVLAEALKRAKLKRPLLLIAGDGEARSEVKAAFKDAPCGVRFLGKIAPDELVLLYAAADLLVWPAINEAFGMALLEAQACGLPVLAGASGGVPGIVADGKTGFLVPPGDATAFAAALRRAFTCDLPAMGRAARHKVERRHDIAAASATFARTLAKLGVTP